LFHSFSFVFTSMIDASLISWKQLAIQRLMRGYTPCRFMLLCTHCLIFRGPCSVSSTLPPFLFFFFSSSSFAFLSSNSSCVSSLSIVLKIKMSSGRPAEGRYKVSCDAVAVGWNELGMFRAVAVNFWAAFGWKSKLRATYFS